jgi:plasmid stabilization system protein ParE
MPKDIIWSPLAEKDFVLILDYLSKHWNSKVIHNYIDEVDKLLKQISTNPHQFPLIHKRRNIRKCVISKHNSIFYRVRRNGVDVLRIYDTRQEPFKAKNI